jgi:isocitrate dehydrogenase
MQVVEISSGKVIFEHDVQQGDIWRACFTKDAAIKDWVKLGVNRARMSGDPAVFWLNPQRAHDNVLRGLVDKYLKDHDTKGLNIKCLAPEEAIWEAMTRAKKGEDTISVTGNVLRDYLTDLFPILELGTSAKMLSIVPLLNGGGLYETGAGGSAPKHVEQFEKEGHLRWDSLGEFLALAECLTDIGEKKGDDKIRCLAKCLHKANEDFLKNDKNPGRKKMELDTRGSHFYVALYWAQALATQTECAPLRDKFAALAKNLTDNEKAIVDQLINCQGTKVDVGGYYRPVKATADVAMRPSKLLNDFLSGLK